MTSGMQSISKSHVRAMPGQTSVADARIRRRSLVKAAVAVLALGGLALAPTAIARDRRDDGRWVGTWGSSPQRVSSPIHVIGQTLRQIVHTSLGGDGVRVRFSNAYGSDDLVIGSAHVALSAGGASIVQTTDRTLTFNGSPTISIPAGAVAVSDAVTFHVPALGDLAVSVFLPLDVPASTQHQSGLQTNHISMPGDFTGAGTFASTMTDSYYFLTGIDVRTSHDANAIVAIGDSVTNGFASTLNMNQRWPNLLAERLRLENFPTGVVNAGVNGNRILHDVVGTGALARLDRDVLVNTGARYVIVLQGNVDILLPDLIGNPAQNVTAEQIVQGHRQIIERAHAMRLKVYGGTLNPVEGYPFPGFWTAVMEAKRQAVNQWIRTSHAYDAVIDFDLVLRDPAHPPRIRPEFDSGDHVHPNDIGYGAMADAIDLSLFRDDDRN